MSSSCLYWSTCWRLRFSLWLWPLTTDDLFRSQLQNHLLIHHQVLNVLLCPWRWRRRLERPAQSQPEGWEVSGGGCCGWIVVSSGPVQAQLVHVRRLRRWRWSLHGRRWRRRLQRYQPPLNHSVLPFRNPNHFFYSSAWSLTPSNFFKSYDFRVFLKYHYGLSALLKKLKKKKKNEKLKQFFSFYLSCTVLSVQLD